MTTSTKSLSKNVYVSLDQEDEEPVKENHYIPFDDEFNYLNDECIILNSDKNSLINNEENKIKNENKVEKVTTATNNQQKFSPEKNKTSKTSEEFECQTEG